MGKTRKNGVSIITSTIRPLYKNNVFKNYARQKWQSKELIIILNRDDMNIAAYKKRAKKYRNVRVFQMSGRYSLGECLNYAVKRAKYNYIAKFDDDDYYATNYIPEAMHMFKNSKADIVGKPSFFFYFPHRKILLLRDHRHISFKHGQIGISQKPFSQPILFTFLILLKQLLRLWFAAGGLTLC